jgi:serine phosphatase RsbU (regulator of sigma subunit)
VSPPRGQRFGAAERSLLHEAAQRAGLSIRRAQLHAEEHRIAVELQKGLLPKELPVVEGIELAVHYEAAGLAAQVGGDWYDAFPLREGRVGVVLGDVAGRGIPAASAMGQLRSLARGFAYGDGQARAPGEVLTRLNRHQLALGSEEMFTVLYAIVDPATSTVTWANAGHPPPLLRSSSDDVSHLEGGDGLMGIEEVEYQDHSRSIGEQATLVLYTDGLIERRGEPLDAGMARLAAAVRSGPAHADELCEHILRHALPEDRELDDDVTAVVIRLSQSAND